MVVQVDNWFYLDKDEFFKDLENRFFYNFIDLLNFNELVE